MELLQIVFVLVASMVVGTLSITWRYLQLLPRLRPDSKLDHERIKALSLKSTIKPLPNFNFRATPPLKLRPFKPTFNITMALQNSTPSDLIIIDNQYLSRVIARHALITDHKSTVRGVLPPGHAPVQELYTYLLGTYLPQRYPTMFDVFKSRDSSTPLTMHASFHNRVTGCSAPLSSPFPSPVEMLEILGKTVEDDLFLLLPDGDGDGDGGDGDGEGGAHRLVAFVCCHPSGFDPSEKLGKRLVDIHGPVPGYEKIEGSMERYFRKLEVGRCVKRVNWGIQTHPNLYAPSGNHVHPGEEVEEDGEIDLDKARFRVELQSLMRLPKTGAILFSFKTYMYSLEEITQEGLGPQLADAIEGLKAGNAPGMWVYKGGVRWGKAACEYLRAGDGG